MSDLKSGTVVWLKSPPGPSMTIKEVTDSDHVTCNWFDGVKIKEFVFTADQLTTEDPSLPHTRHDLSLLTFEEITRLSELLQKAVPRDADK